jgi:hypothetical protein
VPDKIRLVSVVSVVAETMTEILHPVLHQKELQYRSVRFVALPVFSKQGATYSIYAIVRKLIRV